jgi:hypothetical protein
MKRENEFSELLGMQAEILRVSANTIDYQLRKIEDGIDPVTNMSVLKDTIYKTIGSLTTVLERI